MHEAEAIRHGEIEGCQGKLRLDCIVRIFVYKEVAAVGGFNIFWTLPTPLGHRGALRDQGIF